MLFVRKEKKTCYRGIFMIKITFYKHFIIRKQYDFLDPKLCTYSNYPINNKRIDYCLYLDVLDLDKKTK